MQEVRHDGSEGPWELFDEEKMNKRLDDIQVKEIRIRKLEDIPPDERPPIPKVQRKFNTKARHERTRVLNRRDKNRFARAARRKNRRR